MRVDVGCRRVSILARGHRRSAGLVVSFAPSKSVRKTLALASRNRRYPIRLRPGRNGVHAIGEAWAFRRYPPTDQEVADCDFSVGECRRKDERANIDQVRRIVHAAARSSPLRNEEESLKDWDVRSLNIWV